jgi:hypothetical protein
MLTNLKTIVAGLLLATSCVTTSAAEFFVSPAGTHIAPFTNWVSAATNIQSAIDAATSSDTVWVTNGIYATGGRAVIATMTNRVVLDKPLTLQSVNGPKFTLLLGCQVSGTTNGLGAVRCAWITNGAVLSGFTLTNGATLTDGALYQTQCGGGAYCDNSGALVTNCVLIGNSANLYGGGGYQGSFTACTLEGNSALSAGGGGASDANLTNCILATNSAVQGGGAFNGHLSACTLIGNSASSDGGGAWGGYLNNCTLTGNSAYDGGGASGGYSIECTLVNCTLVANTARSSGGGAFGASLELCTLTANTATDCGGGVYRSILEGCTLLGNSAYEGGGAFDGGAGSSLLISNTAAWGGGASLASLRQCTLKGNIAYAGGGANSSTLTCCLLVTNTAYLDGGGADLSTLLNCTVVGNSATRYGGGASSSRVTNSVLFYNSAPQNPNFSPGNSAGTISYSCTTPLPASGIGNISAAPLLLDPAGGNLRLQSNSPCINFGTSFPPYGTLPSVDLDGRPRVVGHVVDIGAYEFDPRVNPFFIAWLQYKGLPTDGSADYADTNGDGTNNWQEWVASTTPTNAVISIRMLSAKSLGTHVPVTWQSVVGVFYTLEFATNLAPPLVFQAIAANIPGQAGTTTFTHTNAAAPSAGFYRVHSP